MIRVGIVRHLGISFFSLCFDDVPKFFVSLENVCLPFLSYQLCLSLCLYILFVIMFVYLAGHVETLTGYRSTISMDYTKID